MIHFFTKGDETIPSSRQRAHLLATELQKFQVDTIIHTPPIAVISQTPWPKKLELIRKISKGLFQVKKGDILFLQRAIYNKYFFALVVLHHLIFKNKMIFDFDDAIYLHSPFKTKLLTKMADIVIVGSHELQQWAVQYNKHTYLIPTCTYFTNFPQKKYAPEKQGAFILGWTGNAPAHRENLMLLVPVMQELARRGVPIRFVLIGAQGDKAITDAFTSISGIETEIIDWVDPEKIQERIQTFDVGLMPLTDTPWNRGKCALKVVEYMACGVPAIASPVGENAYVIKNGVNGFLPTTTQDWVSVIEKINANYQTLQTMGTQARTTIEASYVYGVQLVHILDLIGK